MEMRIYNLLFYIKTNNKIPTSEELNINDEVLNNLIRKCNNEGLLDKSLIYVNILGEIECDEMAELAITIKGLNYLKNNNPVGEII